MVFTVPDLHKKSIMFIKLLCKPNVRLKYQLSVILVVRVQLIFVIKSQLELAHYPKIQIQSKKSAPEK